MSYSQVVTGPADRLLASVAVGLFGLAIGSFLNVVVHRLPRGMSVVRPRSHCTACGTELAGIDNVPVLSWVALRGRCRHCTTPISFRYPVVELLTGLLFAGTAAALGGEPALAPLLLLEASVVAAAAIDFDRSAAPSAVVVGGLLGATGVVGVAAATGHPARVGWALAATASSALPWAAAEALARRHSVPPATVVGPAPADIRRPAQEGATGRVLLVASMAAVAGCLWPLGGWVMAAGAVPCALVAGGLGRARSIRLLLVAPLVLFAAVVTVGATAGGARAEADRSCVCRAGFSGGDPAITSDYRSRPVPVARA